LQGGEKNGHDDANASDIRPALDDLSAVVCADAARPRAPRAGLAAVGLALIGIAVLVVWFLTRGGDEVPVDRDELTAAEQALAANPPEADRSLVHLSRIRSNERGVLARAKLAEGKARYLLAAYDEAESCWLEALRLDPKVPEAGWALLDLYYLEGRLPEAAELALRQHEVEPDPRDRVRFLIELVRQDAEPPDPASVVMRFEPAARAHPGDLHARLTLGTALVHSSRIAEGIEVLEAAVRDFPDRFESWDALFDGLDGAGRQQELIERWGRAPVEVRGDRRLARIEGAVAWARGDLAAAAAAYRRAWSDRSDDLTASYRLARVLHALGRKDEADGIDRFNQDAGEARAEVPDLYRQIDAATRRASRVESELFQRLARNRERLGRLREARAWHRLVLEQRPRDQHSLDALQRLESRSAIGGAPDG
jgi:tetratricopeptide (TPR) repeat protein